MSESEAAVAADPVVVDTPPRKVSRWLGLAIGVGAAALGLLPWLITGIRLPLQNLWDAATMPDDYPLVLLPFSQYAILLLFGLIVTGWAVAGLVARALRPRLQRGGVLLTMIGVLAVQIVATVQTAIVVGDGLQERWESTLYLAALDGVAGLSIVIGAIAFWLIARAPRAGALLGLTAGAIALSPWLGSLIVPFGTWAYTTDTMYMLAGYVQWVPPVLVGVAIAWTGVNTIGRVVSALISLALLWVAPAVMTGIGNAAGSRVLAHEPLQMLDYGVNVFFMALLMPELALPPLVVAVVVAIVGLAVGYIVRRGRTAKANPDQAPTSADEAATPSENPPAR